MSTIMNEGVNIHFQVVTTQVFTVEDFLVKLSTAIAKPKGFIET